MLRGMFLWHHTCHSILAMRSAHMAVIFLIAASMFAMWCKASTGDQRGSPLRRPVLPPSIRSECKDACAAQRALRSWRCALLRVCDGCDHAEMEWKPFRQSSIETELTNSGKREQ